ncbi:hypothetical protein [Streptomyces sp. NPDC058424]|uniref:hypothetical protein n=1 Tax=Streptomyces sp. NPDC058424 TaxID=3346491 RepID=UPI00364A1038
MDQVIAASALTDTIAGYRLVAQDRPLPGGKPIEYRFTITGPDGKPVTDFAVAQTKRMHFYAIRADLTGVQHAFPTMADDGTWTVPLAPLGPGVWHLIAFFTPGSGPGEGKEFALSSPVTVPGAPTGALLPAAARTTQVDGYTVSVDGTLMRGMAHPLTVTIRKGAKPVTDLEPYLGASAHLAAFHEGDLAFAPFRPVTAVSVGSLGQQFRAAPPTPGNWRLFVQFRTGGKLHTAALTLQVY